MRYTKVIMKKKEFVHKELYALLRKIDPKIIGIMYTYEEDGETVRVFYDEAVVRVDVTADSLSAMVTDVLLKIA